MPYSDGPMDLPCLELTGETSHEELYQMGIVYATGLGVGEDLVAAHKWFNLAALKGNTEAKDRRREIAEQMSAIDISEAQKAAREWLSKLN